MPERSAACGSLLARAERVLAGGPGTFSKHHSRYPVGFAPFALESGEGTFVTGSNGRTYLDTVGALGPNLLGYGHPAVTEAIIAQASRGASFSMVTELEITVAETLCSLFPAGDMVRFGKNGTDVTGMATRLARALTGHKHVIFIGYAGGACDSYGITTTKRAGLLAEIAPYNHQRAWGDECLETLVAQCALSGGLAGIMVEVPALLWGTEPAHFHHMLVSLQDLAHKYGGLFLFDEVVTFPRYGLHGAQGCYHVRPDLWTVSKAIGNGLPLAALIGPRHLMKRLNDGDIFASWTFAGECLALAACQTTLATCQATDALATIQRAGQAFGAFLSRVIESFALPATLIGNYARLALRWEDVPGIASGQELRTLWMQEQARRGVLYGIGVVFPNACWDGEVLHQLEVATLEVAAVMQDAITTNTVAECLDCPVISDVLSARPH